MNFNSPEGTSIETSSPFFLPSNPFPIGDWTEILPCWRSDSSSETIVYSNSLSKLRLRTFTLDKIDTLSVLISDSSITLALLIDSSSFDILSSWSPWASLAASYSAFSDKSPLSLASAIWLAISALPFVLRRCSSSFNFQILFCLS